MPSYAGEVESTEKDTVIVPLYYHSESMEHTFGVAGVTKGVGQDQGVLFGTALYSTNESYVGFFSANNYKLTDDFLFSARAQKARFNGNTYYLGEDGKNDSDGVGVITDGLETKLTASFRYVLPLGENSSPDQDISLFGREVVGSLPFNSGITTLGVSPFYTSREVESINEDASSTGFTLSFDWDNRDSVRLATKGSHTSFDLTFGSSDWGSDETWSIWELSNSQFFDIGPLSNIFEKQVIGFDFYLADTPTWDSSRPPEHDQVSLGGLYKLRSYTGNRFHGRSAIHYSAEYRVMPEWQPLNEIPYLDYYQIPWWQWVAFVDVGRVADDFNLETLHEDMQWSVGAAVRFQIEGIVVRTEVARGSEEGLLRVMINQPF